MLDDEVILPCGSKVSVKDFYDLLEKLKTNSDDHTSGCHLTKDDILVKSQEEQDVVSCLHMFSEYTATFLENTFLKAKQNKI